jgi:hypothetical protein
MTYDTASHDFRLCRAVGRIFRAGATAELSKLKQENVMLCTVVRKSEVAFSNFYYYQVVLVP